MFSTTRATVLAQLRTANLFASFVADVALGPTANCLFGSLRFYQKLYLCSSFHAIWLILLTPAQEQAWRASSRWFLRALAANYLFDILPKALLSFSDLSVIKLP